MAVYGKLIERCFERCELGAGELHLRGTEVLDDALLVFGAWDGHDVRLFVQHPCERDLGRRAPFQLGELRNDVDDGLIPRDVSLRELGHPVADIIVTLELRLSGYLPRQKPARYW